MGKLTDWKKEKEAEQKRQTENNIIMNPAAFELFLENIEDLDFDFKKRDADMFEIRVLLIESSIKYPKKENYPFVVYIGRNYTAEKMMGGKVIDEVVLTMGPHTKTFSREECETLFILWEWLDEHKEPNEIENLADKFIEKNRKGPISWGN